MRYQELADGITSSLGLSSPPITLSFVEKAPEGVPTFEQAVPSSCTFWRAAEATTFYAAADRHYNCPVGALTMGFDLPNEVQENLMGFVQLMTGSGYISADEPPRIPTVKKKKSGILYGPLRDSKTVPDLVLLWLNPRQAMIYNEAVGNAPWTVHEPSSALGRPACAALPNALEESRAQLSMGCAGMRTFTEISDDRLLGVVPGERLDEFMEGLKNTVDANKRMQDFYDQHKARFAST